MSRSYSREMKLIAVARIQEGETKACVAREFNVSESTIRGWCKSRKLQEEGQNMYPKLTARHDFNEMMQMRQHISLAASQGENSAVHRTYKQDTKKISHTGANQVGNSLIMVDEQIEHPYNIAVKKELKQDTKELSHTQANQVGNSSIIVDEEIVHPNNIAIKKEPNDEDINLEEALDYGKKYLQWLETCRHPRVTMMHVESLRLLLNNLEGGK